MEDISGDGTRREFLRAVGGSAAVLASGGLLSACGSSTNNSSHTASSTSTASGTPKYGGTLRYGGTGGSDHDSLDAQNGLTQQDFTRIPTLYEGLVAPGPTGELEYLLAESITPNTAATQWTIKIRPGVLTHDLKPFGARDVLYSINRIIKNKFPGATSFGPINLAASKVMDPLTVRLQFDKPFGLFLTFLQGNFIFLYMVPEGYNPKSPIGTGPFKLKNFSPGVSSTVVRFDQYWMHGLPYLDEVVSNDVAEETAQIDGLESGQFNAISYLSASSVATLRSNPAYNVVISKSGGWLPFTMRVDKAPFSDVRVRQALRLIVDRPKMLEEVFSGYGLVGNDMFGIFDPFYDHTIPQRVQDIPQAKSLLKAAGFPNLSVELVTSTIADGVIEEAAVFATQAQAAGVTVKVNQIDTTQFYANSYLKAPFSQDNWGYAPYLVNASQATVASAPFNETHFSNPQYNALYQQAFASTDPEVHKSVVHQMQRIDYNEGGLIIPLFNPLIDVTASNVKGDVPNIIGQGGLDGFNLRKLWIDQS